MAAFRIIEDYLKETYERIIHQAVVYLPTMGV